MGDVSHVDLGMGAVEEDLAQASQSSTDSLRVLDNPVRKKFVKNSTSAIRFGKDYPGGGQEEFDALVRLHKVDPQHVVEPISTILDNEGRVIGFNAEELDAQTLEDWQAKHGGVIPGDFRNQIKNALSAFHAAGLVHGDVKSNNILVTKDGVLKFFDPVGYGEIPSAELQQYIDADLDESRYL
jgi:aminoglycoside phosphotransferase (APT) family kinase protein